MDLFEDYLTESAEIQNQPTPEYHPTEPDYIGSPPYILATDSQLPDTEPIDPREGTPEKEGRCWSKV